MNDSTAGRLNSPEQSSLPAQDLATGDSGEVFLFCKFLASRRVGHRRGALVAAGTAKTAGTSPAARLVCDLRGTLRYNSGMIATKEALTKLTTVPSEQEAAIIVASLVAVGIDACYMGETTANFRVGVPGKVHVYVSEAEFEHARQLLNSQESHVANASADEEEKPSAIRQFAWKTLVLLILFLCLLMGM